LSIRTLAIFFILGVATLVATGVPIAFAFGIATVGYVALATPAPLTVVVSRMDEGMSHLLLLSIPLFVFLGILIDMTGMARAMVAFLASLLGHIRGGSPSSRSVACRVPENRIFKPRVAGVRYSPADRPPGRLEPNRLR
jgi:TRAP-type mannitol/chloroaromatic compound transport system permease large subunit